MDTDKIQRVERKKALVAKLRTFDDSEVAKSYPLKMIFPVNPHFSGEMFVDTSHPYEQPKYSVTNKEMTFGKTNLGLFEAANFLIKHKIIYGI